MVAYLAVRTGPEKGKHFPLDSARPMHIGRGTSCEIMLTDPVSSRFHAVVYYEDGNWHLRDTSSRNGTLVNGQKTDHARLLDQSLVTIGGTEMRLVEPQSNDNDENLMTQTIVQDVRIVERTRHMGDDDSVETPAVCNLLDLYQLSLQLLRNSNFDEILGTLIDLLRDRTGADVVGISFDAGEGRMKPQRISPPDSKESLQLTRSLTKRVVGEGDAVWINDPSGDFALREAVGKEKPSYSDVMFVPLDNGDGNLGVLHLYREKPSFKSTHFDLAVAAGRLLATGLARGIERDSLRSERKSIAEKNADTNELIGTSRVMVKLKERIDRVGRASGSVLIRGESGVGKELVARAVHRSSQRARRPMLTVNCAAIPHDLIESQLFGHRKGSFTGADADHNGLFQQAHTGTLFLDEIGELTLDGQAKLLRILEGHPFLPVGATTEVLVDVRVIAATNRDLAEFVRAGQFREDLFYRLSVFELLVPPLRDRDDDVEVLIEHFLDHFRRQHGRPSLMLSSEALASMKAYAWPGNIRQLRNVIDSAVVMADEPEIMPEDLGLRDAGVSRLDTLCISDWERRLILKALQRTDGNVPAASKMLGISRATAYRKIAEYNIER